MSPLPLNIPFLLKRLCPDAKYVVHGRSYDDIEWLDPSPKPSVKELEVAFLQIQGAEKAHEDSLAKIKRVEKLSAHDKLELAKKESADEMAALNLANISEIDRVKTSARIERERRAIEHRQAISDIIKQEEINLQAEVDKIDSEFSLIRAKFFKVKEDRHNQCWVELVNYSKEQHDAAVKYLTDTDWYVHRQTEYNEKKVPDDIAEKRKQARLVIGDAVKVFGNWHTIRAKEYPSKEQMVEALRSGRQAIIEDAKEIFSNWQEERAKELPTAFEMSQAIKGGKDAIREVAKRIEAVKKKYPKPKKKEDWR